jgi:GTP-binding protein EngB required for normal cell division
MENNIVAVAKNIETIISKYNDIIGKQAQAINRDLNIEQSDTIENNIKSRKDENKLLEIGIVGRVKAGKSSLLNALFFNGDNVLPKAATPMTAALTVLSYGDELSVEVEFYSKKDIDNIKNNSLRFQEKLEELIEQYVDEAQRQNMRTKAKSLMGFKKKELKNYQISLRLLSFSFLKN